MKEEIAELEERAASDGFWNDLEKSQQIVQRTSMLKKKVEAYEGLVSDYEDTLALIEMADEEGDDSMVDECAESVQKVKDELDRQTLDTLLIGEYDS